MKTGNLFEALVVGIVAIALVLPSIEKSLERDHIDINGIIIDFVETAQESISRQVDRTPSPEQ